MNHPARQFWFGNYWWLTPVASVGAIAIILAMASEESRLSLIASVIGGAFGVLYFIQKQMLDETQLFERLFSQFNKRYADLNDKLQDIRAGRMADEQKARKVLDDYFNLCAEEYLFYSEGRIHPAAWQSWCRGMIDHFTHESIIGHWNREVKSGSYYGLTLETIQKGAT